MQSIGKTPEQKAKEPSLRKRIGLVATRAGSQHRCEAPACVIRRPETMQPARSILGLESVVWI